MKYCQSMLAAAAIAMAACAPALAQGYVPTPPIARPSVLPKPVANRLIKRDTKAENHRKAPAGN
jgi:hypothetical protein